MTRRRNKNLYVFQIYKLKKYGNKIKRVVGDGEGREHL